MSKAKKKKSAAAKQKAVAKDIESQGVEVSAESAAATPKVSFEQLRQFNKWIVILCAVQAAAITLIGTGKSFPVLLHYITPDPLQADAVAEGSHPLFWIRLATLLGLGFLASAVIHLFWFNAGKPQYESALNRNIQPFRWLGNVFSYGLLLLAVALVAGIFDFLALLAVFGINAIAQSLRALAERQSPPSKKLALAAAVLDAGLWLAILATVVLTLVFDHAPAAYVWAVVAALGLASAGMATAPLLAGFKTGRLSRLGKDARSRERLLLVFEFALPSLIAWLIFAGALLP